MTTQLYSNALYQSIMRDQEAAIAKATEKLCIDLADARETIKAQQIVIDQLRGQLESRARVIDGEDLA